jgi:hypothetical protein
VISQSFDEGKRFKDVGRWTILKWILREIGWDGRRDSMGW